MKNLNNGITQVLSSIILIVSSSATALPMTRYHCTDQSGEMKLSLDVMINGQLKTKGFLTAIDKDKTINANINDKIFTIVGMDFIGYDQNGIGKIKFKDELGHYVYIVGSQSTPMDCTVLRVDKPTIHCLEFSCGSHGIISTPFEAPVGYRCTDTKPICKTSVQTGLTE